jgi:hypothetical protein
VAQGRDKNLAASLVGKEATKDATDAALEKIASVEDSIRGGVTAYSKL